MMADVRARRRVARRSAAGRRGGPRRVRPGPHGARVRQLPRRDADARRATARRPPPSGVGRAGGQDAAGARAGGGRRRPGARRWSCRSTTPCRAWRSLDDGAGTVWAADATEGYHGGGSLTRWVTDDAEAAAVAAELGAHARAVRIMPFLDGIACSIHGIVLPDGVVVLRPVELVTLRQGHQLRYAGCATFWDPPDAVRETMRDAARRVGAELRRARRLPWRVHARRRRDPRRLPADRAEPPVRRRARRDHTGARRTSR